jgi:hypothetical protein
MATTVSFLMVALVSGAAFYAAKAAVDAAISFLGG